MMQRLLNASGRRLGKRKGKANLGPVSQSVTINCKLSYYMICHWATIDINRTINRNPFWNGPLGFSFLFLLGSTTFTVFFWREKLPAEKPLQNDLECLQMCHATFKLSMKPNELRTSLDVKLQPSKAQDKFLRQTHLNLYIMIDSD